MLKLNTFRGWNDVFRRGVSRAHADLLPLTATELSDDRLIEVNGGLNPQPLPPRWIVSRLVADLVSPIVVSARLQ